MLFLDRNGQYQTVRGCPLFYLPLLSELLVILAERCGRISTIEGLDEFYQGAIGGKSLIDRILKLHDIDPSNCSTENLIELLFDPGLLLIKSEVRSRSAEVSHTGTAVSPSDLFESVATSIASLVTFNLALDLKGAIKLAQTNSASELRLYQNARYRQLHPEIEEKEEVLKEGEKFMSEINSGEMFNDNFRKALMQ